MGSALGKGAGLLALENGDDLLKVWGQKNVPVFSFMFFGWF